MTVPALPSDDSAGQIWTAAKVNAIYDHLQWWRDTRPVFKGAAFGVDGSKPESVPNNALTTFGFGAAGSFNTTPLINVGSFTVDGAEADPEPLHVPETGIYWVAAYVDFDANTTGRREIKVNLAGTAVAGLMVNISSASAGDCRVGVSGIVDITATTQDILLEVFQNSGAELDTGAVYLSMVWMQST